MMTVRHPALVSSEQKSQRCVSLLPACVFCELAPRARARSLGAPEPRARQMSCPFAKLGLPPSASQDDVKAAYRLLGI